jgi:hypothetical protein
MFFNGFFYILMPSLLRQRANYDFAFTVVIWLLNYGEIINCFSHFLFPWHFVFFQCYCTVFLKNVFSFQMFVEIMFRLSSQIWQIPIFCRMVRNGLHMLKKRNRKCIWLDQIVSKISSNVYKIILKSFFVYNLSSSTICYFELNHKIYNTTIFTNIIQLLQYFL